MHWMRLPARASGSLGRGRAWSPHLLMAGMEMSSMTTAMVLPPAGPYVRPCRFSTHPCGAHAARAGASAPAGASRGRAVPLGYLQRSHAARRVCCQARASAVPTRRACHRRLCWPSGQPGARLDGLLEDGGRGERGEGDRLGAHLLGRAAAQELVDGRRLAVPGPPTSRVACRTRGASAAGAASVHAEADALSVMQGRRGCGRAFCTDSTSVSRYS